MIRENILCRLSRLAVPLCAALAAAISLVPVAAPVFAGTVYHVTTAGNDEGDGSEGAPFASVQRALEAAGAGDTVQVGPGKFIGQSRFVNSGEEGAPVVLRGTLGEDGERLTRLEAGEAVEPETWEPAPEVGPNVWQNQSFGYEPQLLMVDGKFLAHVHRSRGLAIEYLAAPEDRVVETRGVEIPFWETLGGIYAYHPDPERKITWLRLAGGADPRERSITVSPGGAILTVEGVSHLEIRDLEIAAGDRGISIRGEGTRHVLVENCRLEHGRRRLEIINRASDITVRGCEFSMGFFGHETGAWGAAELTREQGRKAYLYGFFKYRHGQANASDDYSIRCLMVSRIIIEDNLIHTGLQGVNLNTVSNSVVRNNSISSFSSIGVMVGTRTENVHVCDNRIHDCNINIRIHQLGIGRRNAFIYRNRLSQGNAGGHIFCSPAGEDILDEKVTIYHNSFHGGGTGLTWTLASIIPKGIPSFRVINNVFSSSRPTHLSRILEQNPDAVGAFDYNWMGGDSARFAGMPWCGGNNIIVNGERAWAPGEKTDFRLPEGHAARGAGIDLSRPFKIGGVEHEPLPGMEPGYFSGERPDMGAVQH